MKKHRQDQMTLGELIDALRHMPRNEVVIFDFGRFVPQELHSYRGYYEDLAIGYAQVEWAAEPKVANVLATLRAAVGKDFYGWKGGSYTIGSDTPVWVSTAEGDAGNTVIIGVEATDQAVVLKTGHADLNP